MTALEKAETLLADLNRAEKARLLQRLVSDLAQAFPGIERDPGALGGEARIVRTRIPVWALVRAKQLGASEADLLSSYPTLGAEDLVNAWTYYAAHSEEIDRQISEHEAA